MASNDIYDSGEDRKPDWKEAPAAYNEEGVNICTMNAWNLFLFL